MSEEKPPEDISQDMQHFVNTFCDFHKGFPSENQQIFGQVYEQVKRADKHNEDYIQSDKGQEEIWTFESSGVTVYKRVFHPGPGEGPVGVDFALYKEVKPSNVGATAVQVKRNRTRNFFEFQQRDLDQLRKLAKYWGSAYYLMVDETTQPPLYCFLTVTEVDVLIGQAGRIPSVKVLNKDVRRHCRGLDNFTIYFTAATEVHQLYLKTTTQIWSAIFRETRRVVVELSTRRKRTKEPKTKQKPKSDLDGRMRGFIDSF